MGTTGEAENQEKPSRRKSRESKHLQNILPEKVWTAVLDQLTQSEDLENLSNASPYLRDLLLPKRVLFLFPKVLPILVSHKLNYERTSLTKRGKVYKKARGKAWSSAISSLNGRMVCTSWRDGVDHFFQHHPSHTQTDQDDLYRWIHAVCQGTHAIFNSGQNDTYNCRQTNVFSFLEHFEKTHEREPVGASDNPFISRSASFEDSPDGELELTATLRYWNGITEVLRRYGHHLWYCDILLEDKLPTLYYLKLRQWLQLMPNLRVLNIAYCESSNDQNGKASQSFEQLFMWKKEISQHQLPTLDQLEFSKAHGLPSPIFNELIRVNTHVSRIEFNPIFGGHLQPGYDIYSMRLPNLKNLSLTFGSPAEIRNLDQCQGSWKLDTLDLRYAGHSGYVKWSWIFQILNRNWSDTLTNLSLYLPPPETVEEHTIALKEYGLLRLDLRLIKRLKITLWDYLPIDILLPLKFSLEYLQIVVDLRIQEDKDWSPLDYPRVTKLEKVKFLQMMPFHMNDSNVWRVFSKLQTMRVQHWGGESGWRGQLSEECWHYYSYLYTRKEYDRRQQMDKKIKLFEIQTTARKVTLALVIFSLFILLVHTFLFRY